MEVLLVLGKKDTMLLFTMLAAKAFDSLMLNIYMLVPASTLRM